MHSLPAEWLNHAAADGGPLPAVRPRVRPRRPIDLALPPLLDASSVISRSFPDHPATTTNKNRSYVI